MATREQETALRDNIEYSNLRAVRNGNMCIANATLLALRAAEHPRNH